MTELLIVDDDRVFCRTLANSLGQRGFAVTYVHSVAEAEQRLSDYTPEYAVLDLKMPGDSGLMLISKLLAADPYTRIVVLTGYASVATAVEAIKLGAVHYLAKPADSDEILAAFEKQQGNPAMLVEKGLANLNKVEIAHIRAALERNHWNISATARELGVHRRTLQRKLEKNGITAA